MRSFLHTKLARAALIVAVTTGTLRSQTAPSEPTISIAPSSRVIAVGGTLTITASSSGTAPLSYQWTKDGAVILGATSSAFTVSSFQTSNTGTYSVTVSNVAGQVAQTGAIVGLENSPLTLNISATGSGVLSYQWSKDGTPILGATSSLYVISSLKTSDAGVYTVVISNSGSTVTRITNVVVLQAPAATAPTITVQPTNQTASAGFLALFSVTATPFLGTTYQWNKNGAAIPGATSFLYSITSAAATDAGSYTVTVSNGGASVTSSAATLTISGSGTTAPTISVQPTNQTASAGFLALFSVTATGTSPLAYQWNKNGAPISGATSFLFTINATQSSDAGSYTVTVSNSAGSATSNAATLTVTGTAVAPSITTQPSSQTVTAGANVLFAVVAGGASPLSYQWSKNSTAIPNGTGATLSLGNVQASDAGSYTVVVTNSAGSITASAAQLTVNPAAVSPAITTQPNNQTAVAGTSVSFSLNATGTAPLSYQWRKDGAAIAGATNATLTLTSVQPTDAGSYTAVVTNAAGNTVSNAAALTVTIPNPGRLINLSVLTPLAANETVTMGTVLGGAGTIGTKALLVRAAGPSLSQFGVATFLPNPMMTLNNTSSSPAVVVATNNGWAGSSTLSNAFAAVGAFPYTTATSKDSAVFQQTIAAGNYTVQVTDLTGGSGTVIVELYDSTPNNSYTATTPRLINVSVLKQIAAGTTLTAGFVIGGSTTKTVLVRAVGPTLGLAPFNIAGVLADPKLDLFSGQTVISSNNDWGTPVGTNAATSIQLSTAFTSVGAFTLANTITKDAALLVTLAPGSYTAQVSGVGGTGGLMLVEVYEVP